jgi:hypothetical protein
MGTADLDNAIELVCLGLQFIPQLFQCGQKIIRDLLHGGKVYTAWYDVIARLPHIHMIIGVNGVPAADLSTEQLVRTACYDFIRIHIG